MTGSHTPWIAKALKGEENVYKREQQKAPARSLVQLHKKGVRLMRFRYPQRVFYGKQYKAGKSEITEQ